MHIYHQNSQYVNICNAVFALIYQIEGSLVLVPRVGLQIAVRAT